MTPEALYEVKCLLHSMSNSLLLISASAEYLDELIARGDGGTEKALALADTIVNAVAAAKEQLGKADSILNTGKLSGK